MEELKDQSGGYSDTTNEKDKGLILSYCVHDQYKKCLVDKYKAAMKMSYDRTGELNCYLAAVGAEPMPSETTAAPVPTE